MVKANRKTAKKKNNREPAGKPPAPPSPPPNKKEPQQTEAQAAFHMIKNAMGNADPLPMKYVNFVACCQVLDTALGQHASECGPKGLPGA